MFGHGRGHHHHGHHPPIHHPPHHGHHPHHPPVHHHPHHPHGLFTGLAVATAVAVDHAIQRRRRER
jgi:hypothetical protein